MPKRKRDINHTQEQSFSHVTDQAIRLTASRFKAHFENGVKSLTAQIKLARAFDRQKMTRRVKQAGSNVAKLERLQTELAVLKDLDASAVASNYLLKQCVKTKKIRECSGFSAVFGTDAEDKVKGTTSIAETNVLARLFKSNPVGEVLPKFMQDIRMVLGVDREDVHKKPTVMSVDQKSNISSPYESEEFDGFSDISAEEDETREVLLQEDGMLNEQEEKLLEAYDVRLAASSDSDSEVEKTIQNNFQRGNSMSITSEEDNHRGGGQLDPDEELSSSSQSNLDEVDNSLHPVKLNGISLIPSKPSKPSNTSALPSLMHGGYYSGSDSASDFDPDQDAQVAAMAKPRKNRRGQQARRAIAEKKHGNKAKHLLTTNGVGAVRNDMGRSTSAVRRNGRESGWDPRRGAVGASRDGQDNVRGKGTNRHEQRNGFGGQKDTTASSSNISGGGKLVGKSSTRAPEKPLHPSWEAARKKKMESAGVGTGFVGKKITFD